MKLCRFNEKGIAADRDPISRSVNEMKSQLEEYFRKFLVDAQGLTMT